MHLISGRTSPRERTAVAVEEGPRWPSIADLGQAVALAVAITAVTSLVLPQVSGFGGDDRHYVQMAIDPEERTPTPFAFRVLTPWLVRLLDGDLMTFQLLSLGFLAAAGVFVYLISRGIGATHWPSLLAIAGLLTLRGWLFNVYNPFLADPAAMSLTGAAFAALVWRATSLLPSILVFWALSRELWAGFALPAYMYLRDRLVDVRALASVGVLLLPALVVYEMVIHLVPQTGAAGLGRISWWVVEDVMAARLTEDLGWWIIYTFAGSLGIWWVFSLAALDAGKALWWWCVPVFGQMLLGADWSRFAMYAYVVVIPVGAIAIWRHPRRPVLVGLVALQLIPTIADLATDNRLKLNQDQPSVWFTFVLMIAASVVLWVRNPIRSRRGLPQNAAP